MKKYLSFFLSLPIFLSTAKAGTCPADAKYVNGDGATFVSQSVPNSMEAGRSYQVSVTFCNSGSTTWTYVAPPANGSYIGTTNYIRLGSRFPRDNTIWGLNRVNLSPGDNITPGTTKTFSFAVTAPAPAASKAMQQNNFQFGIVREQVAWIAAGANEYVNTFYTPTFTLQNTPVTPPVSVPASGFGAFGYANFAGANSLGRRYLQSMPYTHTMWLPTGAALTNVVNNAKAMNLKVLRLTLVIPPDATNPEYQQSDWNWASPVYGPTTNDVNVNTTINMATAALNAAGNANLKVILTLDGYTEYDTACTAGGLWKKSFDAVKANAATIVHALSSNSELYAWDILNEPLWDAESFGCLDQPPSANADYLSQSQSYGKLTLPAGANATTQSIAEIVEAVHAMYNVVRQNDIYNHPTTVGEGQAAYVHYWTDISSFASPHLYVNPIDLIHAQDDANNSANNQGLLYTGSTSSDTAMNLPYVIPNGSSSTGDPLLVRQIPAIASATINVMKSEAIGADSVPLPLIIGEYGMYNAGLSDTYKQQGFYTLFLPTLSGGTQSLTAANIGGLFWSLQTILPDNQYLSLSNSTGGLLLAACTVASSLGASPMPTCSPQ